MAKGANVYLLYREGGREEVGLVLGGKMTPVGETGYTRLCAGEENQLCTQSVLIKYSAALVAPESHLDGGVGKHHCVSGNIRQCLEAFWAVVTDQGRGCSWHLGGWRPVTLLNRLTVHQTALYSALCPGPERAAFTAPTGAFQGLLVHFGV